MLFVLTTGLLLLGPPACEKRKNNHGKNPPTKQNGNGNENEKLSKPQVPDLEFKTIFNKKMSFSELKGTPVVVNFWGTWCKPCKREIPHFQKAYEEKQGKFELIGFALKDTTQKVKNFREKTKITYPLVVSDMETYNRFRSAAQVQRLAVPMTYFIDREGRVVDQQLGMLTPAQFDRKLNKIIEK